MWLDLCLQFLFTLSALATSSDARSRSEVNLHNANVTCEPTKCPKDCPKGSGGYHYYYDRVENCVRCECGGPGGLADCGEDTKPSLCNSVAISEECEKNSTVRQSCDFSCSQSGQLWWAASEGNLTKVNISIKAGANPLCQRNSSFEYSNLSNMTALHLAALGNHPEVVMTLLNAGVDVNLQTTDGVTPTLYASMNGSKDALEVLIEHKADINIAESTGLTPLMASTDNPDIALFLIEHNADVNIAAHGGLTPLMRAAMMHQLSIVKALINANASLDATGGLDDAPGGFVKATALYHTFMSRFLVPAYIPDIALLLIEHNADVNIAASDGTTPLMMAAVWGQLSLARALINANASLDVTGGSSNITALYYAVVGNNSDIVSLLIEQNADVNSAASDGSTPLMVAAQKGQLSIARAIINANASLDVTGGLGNITALYYAVAGNNSDIVSLLIEQNADVNIAAFDGSTPLIGAARNGQLSIVRALINANASLDATGGIDDASALHYSAENGTQDIALLLLQNGANKMILNKHGQTPAALARANGNNQLADLIESYTTVTTV